LQEFFFSGNLNRAVEFTCYLSEEDVDFVVKDNNLIIPEHSLKCVKRGLEFYVVKDLDGDLESGLQSAFFDT
jgi:hypothetical protein